MSPRAEQRRAKRKVAELNRIAAFREAGKLREALSAARRMARSHAAHADVHNGLGIILHRLERYGEAVAAYRAALALAPEIADIHYNLARSLQADGQVLEACESYRKALSLKPGDPEILGNFASCNILLDRPGVALRAAETALARDPGNADYKMTMARALVAAERPEDAIQVIEPLLAQEPDNSTYLRIAASAAMEFGDTASARAYLRVALENETSDDFVDCLWLLGKIEVYDGNRDAAAEIYRRVIRERPEAANAYGALAKLKKGLVGADDVEDLRTLLQGRQVSPMEQMLQHFAIADCLAELKRYEESFRHRIEGNRLKREHFQYDIAAAERSMDDLRRDFDRDALERLSGAGDPCERPIFVVGMPRSGTTLVEQILASHSDVYGAGELRYLPRIVGEWQTSPPGSPAKPRSFADITREELVAIGANYVEQAVSPIPGEVRVVDKLPANFQYLGLIALALPNARIVHCMRDPVDTCVSCFDVNFSHAHPYTYDLEELGRYFRSYDRLMQHWHSVLGERIHVVDYEAMIQDPEASIRALLDHCGLEWQERCLQFHTTSRPVRTASASQVRQPINRNSLGRAARVARYLGPLMEALAGR